MDNTSQENTSNQPTLNVPQNPPSQNKSRVFLITFIIIAFSVLFGVAGFILGKQNSNVVTTQKSMSNTPLVTQVVTSPTSAILQESADQVKTYKSSFEKLSFRYPESWKIATSKPQSNYPNADTVSIQSPSGNVSISWISAIDGLGGGCNPNVPVNNEEGCPLYEVIDKQKLSNMNMYYVAYVYTTDGVTYSPAFALQSEDGLLTTQRSMGYLLFSGRNNGGASAGLMSGEIPYGRGLKGGTKQEAQAFFTTPEAQQAKGIILSASY